MKVKVDAELCIGCELCVQVAPSLFDMEGGKAVVKTNPVPEGDEAAGKEAADSCPVTAIVVEE